MKAFVHCMVDDKFTNEDTGEIVEFANCHVYMDEHNNTPNKKGRPLTKIKVAKGVINSVDADNLPGWFECENGIAAAGKLIFTKLKHLPNELSPYERKKTG